MSTLLAIAPQFKEVGVSGVTLRVKGLSAAAIASILIRFPEIRDLIKEVRAAARKEGGSVLDLFGGDTAVMLGRLGERAVGAIIAWATGDGNSAEVEEVAAGLGLADQVAILKPCFDFTFPRGVEDFLQTLGLAVPGEDKEAAASRNETGSSTGSDGASQA